MIIGQTISHYKILEKLGEGGMGVVYKAQDTKLDRVVALKFLPELASKTEEVTMRFIREAKTAAALNHPNICTIHQIEEYEDQQFITMEYVEGQTMKDRLKNGALPVDQALNYAAQIAEALAEAHDKGIIHRDIKPQNIMINNQDQIKIMDFGLAKSPASIDLTRTGTTPGTIPYMSPEQLKGEDFNYKTDIWSFGVIFYEMLSGFHPFKGEYEHALIYSIIQDRPIPLNRSGSDITDHLVSLIENMLEKNPENRIGDAKELKQLLNEYITTETSVFSVNGSPDHNNWRYLVFSLVSILISLSLIPIYYSFTSANESVQSIAVIPFDRYADTSTDDYFTDGITEALIMQLAKFDDLRVISRNSSMAYRNTDKSISDIADELNVDAVLSASVATIDNRVRINAYLDRSDDQNIWADQFDFEQEDILILHNEVAFSIADRIGVTLSDFADDPQQMPETVIPEAYQLYLRGKQLLNIPTEENLSLSLNLFDQVLKIDTLYAPAYSAKGLALIHLSNYRYPNEVYPTARDYALKSLEINPDDPNAHLVLGAHALFYQRNWKLTDHYLRKADELNPVSVYSKIYSAFFDCVMSRPIDCLKKIDEAIDMDPINPNVHVLKQQALIFTRKYDEAIQYGFSTLNLFPESESSKLFNGLAYAMKSDSANAVYYLDPIFERYGHLSEHTINPVILTWGIYGYAEIEAREKAMHYISQIIDITSDTHVCAYDLGAVFGRLGDFETAFDWLNRSLAENSPCLPNANVDPRMDVLRNDPRYVDFLEKVGFKY